MEEGTWGALGWIVGVLVFLLISVVFYGGFFKALIFSGPSQTCKSSVDLHIARHIEGISTYDDLKCPAEDMSIKESKDEDIMKETADLMTRCYWKFGENQELFEEDGIYCALCYYVEYEEKGKKISGFRKFLSENNVPQKYGENLKYDQYIIGEATDPKKVDSIGLRETIEIDTSHNYGIFHVYTKNRHMSKVLSAVTGGTIGVIGTAAIVGMVVLPTTIPAIGAVMLISAMGGAISADYGRGLGSEDPADWQAAVLLIPWHEQTLKNLNCSMMPVKQDNK